MFFYHDEEFDPKGSDIEVAIPVDGDDEGVSPEEYITETYFPIEK